MNEQLFWQKPLMDLTEQEWEALCDGCGKCCLVKLEDEDDGSLAYTNVACRFLDENAQCTVYPQRFAKKPGCMQLSKTNIAESAYWLPKTCAYRLRFAGKDLPDWHPLIAGNAELMHQQGHSIAEQFVSEDTVNEDDLVDYIIFIEEQA